MFDMQQIQHIFEIALASYHQRPLWVLATMFCLIHLWCGCIPVWRMKKALQSSVWLALSLVPPRIAVWKRVNLRRSDSREMLKRFQEREIRCLIRIKETRRNTFVVTLLGTRRKSYSMEFIPHQNLGQWLVDFSRSNLSWDEALAVFLCIANQICKGLQALYDCGIDANRDLKPGNVMVVRLKLSLKPKVHIKVHIKLIDMGTVKMSDGTLYTGDGTGMGTIFYGAPECWTDAKAVDSRADVFSLAAILWRVLTYFARVEQRYEREIFYEYWEHGNQTCRFDELWEHLKATLGRALPLYLSSRSNGNMSGIIARLQNIVIRGLNPDPAQRPSFNEFHKELRSLYEEIRQETNFQISEPQERVSRSRPHPILQDGTLTLQIDGRDE